MKIAKVYINETNAHTISCKDIPKGIRGGEVELEYAKGVWDGLIRNVVFTNGRETVPVVNAGELVEIPAEVTDVQNALVRVGVCGIGAEGKIVIPTLWADLRRVSDAVPVDAMPGTDPALPVWAQMLQKTGDLNALETENKTSLVAAVNELAQAKVTSCLLGDNDTLDGLVENGRYYLAGGTDNLLIRQMLRDAGVPVPEEMDAEGVLARALFVDVTRVEGISAGPDDPVGQPCQQLTVYFDLEKGDGTWVYEFHRVHDFTGSAPDGSAWGGWITATKNHLEVEPEVFIAKYGVTTNQEIWEAAYAGKACFVTNGGAVLPLTLCDGTRYMEFTKFSNGENVVITVQRDTWEVHSHEYLREDEIRQVFTAEYGVTTADEVCQAFLEGKGCFAKRNAVVLPLTFCDTGRKVAQFCGMDDGFYMEYRLSAGGWQEIREDHRKAEEITEDTSDDLIPTVGAVREYVAENAGESDPMVVNITGGGPGGNFSADKTYAEMLPVADSGKAVLLVYSGRVFTGWRNGPVNIIFYETATADPRGDSRCFICSPGDVWTYSEVDTPSGESGTMVVNVTGGGPRPLSADKTYEEIFAELRAGRLVFANNNGKLLIATGYDPGGILFRELLTAGADWAIELFCGYGDVWTYTNVDLTGGGAGSVKTVNGIAPDETGNVQLTAQPDWNQNDETAPDYIKNKPFYEGAQTTVKAEWEVPLADGYALPDAEYIFDDVYTIEINGEKFPMMLSWQFDSENNWGYVGFNLKHGENVHSTPMPEDGAMFYLWANDWAGVMPSTGDRLPLSLNVTLLADFALPATVKVLKEEQVISVIDPKYLPLSQADWNQNDSTAPDYINNRPFYSEESWSLVHEAEEVTFYYNDGRYSSVIDTGYPHIFDMGIADIGTTCKVVIDGEEFVGVVKANENNVGERYFGNAYLWDPSRFADTGEPFCVSPGGLDCINIVTTKHVTSCKVSVFVYGGEVVHKLDEKYLPDKVVNRKPLVLDANLSDYYGGHPEAGDEALEAVKTGRQILVRVPNASGDNYVASYSPVYMYQLPCDGQYLYLFYLRDEKQDLSALLGQPAGTVLMPTYGQFMMLLSQRYDHDPLEV